MSELVKKRIYRPELKGANVKYILKLVGLPRNARWEDAAPYLKKMIVAARRSEDHEQVVTLNSVYSFLKQRLFRTCQEPGCGLAVGRPGRGRDGSAPLHCQIHAIGK